jgi:hypothetical protein
MVRRQSTNRTCSSGRRTPPVLIESAIAPDRNTSRSIASDRDTRSETQTC